MNYWQEKTKTEIIVISKDELKDLIREVLSELNIESKSSQNGWMNAMQAARYLGVSRSFLHKARKEGKIKGYQQVPGGIVRYSKKHCNDYIEQLGK